MAQESMRGAFVWYDLVTPDVDQAKRYYTETIGWGTQLSDLGPEPYLMFTAGERPIGGAVTMPKERPPGAPEIPPHWYGYVAVPDVDAAAAKVIELGGKVMHEQTIPTVGRWAIILDPQGASLALFTPAPESSATPIADDALGNVSWAELTTTDHEAAWAFYSELFGWKKTSAMDMGEGMGAYQMFQREGGPSDRSMGGMSSMAQQMGVPPSWLYYVNVEDIDAAVARVKANGGKVLNGPMEVPGGDKVAQCMDDQGAAFAIYAEAK